MLVSELCCFDNQLILVSTKGSFATRKKDKTELNPFATPRCQCRCHDFLQHWLKFPLSYHLVPYLKVHGKTSSFSYREGVRYDGSFQLHAASIACAADLVHQRNGCRRGKMSVHWCQMKGLLEPSGNSSLARGGVSSVLAL